MGGKRVIGMENWGVKSYISPQLSFGTISVSRPFLKEKNFQCLITLKTGLIQMFKTNGFLMLNEEI